MRLFGFGRHEEDPEAHRRREENEQRIAAGGIPLGAEARLREQAGRQGTPGHIFTSDLSVNELVLTRRQGFEPLGQVMGSSVYQVGWQMMPSFSWTSGELGVLTHAYHEVRRLALDRLRQEAALLGASGVIGVRLNHNEYDWGLGLLEVQAIGTAIRESGAPTDASSQPFLSDLSGQEFFALRACGYRPVGIAIGNCSWYQVPSFRTQQATTTSVFGMGAFNQELVDYTQAVYSARSLAMARMEDAARVCQAVGIVGADIHVQTHPREIDNGGYKRIDMLFHYTAVGTALSTVPGKWPEIDVTPVVPLR